MILAIALFVLVLLADQVTKSLVVARLQEGAATAGVLYGIRLRHFANRRRPWNSKAGVRLMAAALVLFTAAAVVFASLIDEPGMYASLGVLVGGAAGNLLDGFNRKAVTDFIDLRIWPVFNVADAAIVAGATLMLVELARL